MGHSFKTLRILSVVFKGMAWVSLVIMAIALVGILMGKEAQGVPIAPVVVNMVVASVVTFLLFFALGEAIRILLVIEEQTRKP